jgi:pimeloyl-ACP methyl ester carboxylesterase
MSSLQTRSSYAAINNARIYYEIAGRGTPLVMIHAGVADSRQWNNEFVHFAEKYQVVRYDMRGYGKSEPVQSEFSHLSDLVTLLETLEINEPMILMGCSMGGGLAMDFALANPSRVKALIMVDAGPGGLVLETETPAKFLEVEKAFKAGDMDLVAELETQIWFDGSGRSPNQVDPSTRKLLFEMDRLVLTHEGKQLGKRLANTPTPAFEHLQDLAVPVLVIIGALDTPYMLAAADYMIKKIPLAQKVVIENAAHLPNMDHPHQFQAIVGGFLEKLSQPSK